MPISKAKKKEAGSALNKQEIDLDSSLRVADDLEEIPDFERLQREKERLKQIMLSNPMVLFKKQDHPDYSTGHVASTTTHARNPPPGVKPT